MMLSNNTLGRTSRLGFAFAAVLALGGCDDHDPVITQDTPVVQRAYTRLAENWLEWAMSQPFSTGPITDTTGASCANGQHGNVWFLAGTTGGPVTRECTVPANTALFFPLINLWAIPMPEQIDTPDELNSFVSFFRGYFPQQRAATCQLTLRVDGEAIFANRDEADRELYVEILTPFHVDLDADNYYSSFMTRPAGRYTALMNGHFALLRPLTPGTHTVEFGGATCDGTTVDFSTTATYTLHVQRPGPGSHALTEADLMGAAGDGH